MVLLLFGFAVLFLFFIREPEKESPGGNTPPVSDTDRLVTADKEEKAEILHKF